LVPPPPPGRRRRKIFFKIQASQIKGLPYCLRQGFKNNRSGPGYFKRARGRHVVRGILKAKACDAENAKRATPKMQSVRRRKCQERLQSVRRRKCKACDAENAKRATPKMRRP